MPRNRREYLLRFADAACNDLDRCLLNLLTIRDAYGEIHPEHVKAVEAMMQIVSQAEEFIKDFRHAQM